MNTQDTTDWKKATSPWTEPFRQSQETRAMTESASTAADAAPRHTEAPMQQQAAEAIEPTRDALSTIFYGN